MKLVCIDCSGDNKRWLDSKSTSNPERTDFCSVCGHRREVIEYTITKKTT